MFPRCNLSRVSTEFLGHSFELSTLTGWNQNIAEACVVSRIFWVIAVFSVVVLCPVSWSFTWHKCNLLVILDRRLKGTSKPRAISLYDYSSLELCHMYSSCPSSPDSDLCWLSSVRLQLSDWTSPARTTSQTGLPDRKPR